MHPNFHIDDGDVAVGVDSDDANGENKGDGAHDGDDEDGYTVCTSMVIMTKTTMMAILMTMVVVTMMILKIPQGQASTRILTVMC